MVARNNDGGQASNSRYIDYEISPAEPPLKLEISKRTWDKLGVNI